MRRWVSTLVALGVLCGFSQALRAQEIKVHTGFIFYSGKYTLDEETRGLYDEGHQLAALLAESPQALEAFRSFEGWHMTANVMTGLALGAIVLGGVFYMPGVVDEVPSYSGYVCFGIGGGLLVFGLVSEFVSWGRLHAVEELHNKSVDIDDGPALQWIPVPSLGLAEGGGQLGLTWAF